jgi:hypothetical protein
MVITRFWYRSYLQLELYIFVQIFEFYLVNQSCYVPYHAALNTTVHVVTNLNFFHILVMDRPILGCNVKVSEPESRSEEAAKEDRPTRKTTKRKNQSEQGQEAVVKKMRFVGVKNLKIYTTHPSTPFTSV